MDGVRSRSGYKLFSPFDLGSLRLKNRIVRSATWDPAMIFGRRVDGRTLDTYRKLAHGGAAMIIVGDFNVVPRDACEPGLADSRPDRCSYDDVRIAGFPRLADAVHGEDPDVRIVAQVTAHVPGKGVSAVRSPLTGRAPEPLTATEIGTMVEYIAIAIEGIRDDGFDAAQLHAAHGSLLCRFLSPYSNRRDDEYGGSPEGRTRLFSEIVERTRARVGSFPILTKLNGTDYIEGGIDPATLKRQTQLLADVGISAIEVSGGMHESLLRSEEELGFRPVPMPESHTRIASPDRQSYFLPYARTVDPAVPTILTGGNLDAERLERILQDGAVDLIGLSRPLIREPDLPERWLHGRGSSIAACLSCNACIFDMHDGIRAGRPGHTRCLVDEAPDRLAEAAEWLAGWVDSIRSRSREGANDGSSESEGES
jgi:2,4-dienoyl-CoA reductase-like NADH-dependent reductase (Old Yellow Enzyme family)